MEIGYACINNTLKDKNITTNRGMKKATFLSKGLPYASKLTLYNIKDLFEIIKWNSDNNIKLFRMSSDLFPWMSEYSIHELPDSKEINNLLYEIGQFAISNRMRLSFHPGQFNILCSPREDVVNKTIKDLNQHSYILDAMGLPCNHSHKVNIHIGGAYGNKSESLDRWIHNFNRLDPSIKSRLTLENDDKPNMYTVEDLIPISKLFNIPIVFDFHHYDCNPGNISKEESLKLALSTWPEGIIPMTHYSSSRKIYEDNTCKNVSHADYIYEKIPFTDKYNFNVMLETKAKELGLLKYLKDYSF